MSGRSSGPETPDKQPVVHETTQDPVNAPERTEDQKVSPTHAQESGGGSVPAELRAEDREPVQVARKKGMFGGSLGNDTSGYGGLDVPVLLPGAAERPYGSYFDEVVDALEAAAPEAFAAGLERVVVDRGELTLHVHRDHLQALVRPLRDDARLRFEVCTGVSGVHWPQQTGAELHAVYHFQSITHGVRRVRLEVTCPDDDPRIPSIVATYPTNDWHERETYDMFGIVFEGHPGLTRILMPDDWPGHPQRKDYPLGGIPVEYKGATIPAPDQRRSYT
ncbi:NADH-quinone oxidoreductase subunit C [uncultured Serinicoccus sp.]|uniref:NADH-quinone oxidoreductase subunit C n=1 Tax=uncultured Serinicoccus sp. TaxID=735514 RepID=UPI0026261DF8|nr:NADH-quinone oxidoreductase subunit C [uncultured Serinicoccus sp.]